MVFGYAAPSATATPVCEQTPHAAAAYELDDLDQWLLQNLRSDDLIDSRRRDLIDWLEAADCTVLSARWLGGEQWEVRFTSDECATPAQAERLLRLVARGCRCIPPDRIAAVVMDNRVSALLRLQPRPESE